MRARGPVEEVADGQGHLHGRDRRPGETGVVGALPIVERALLILGDVGLDADGDNVYEHSAAVAILDGDLNEMPPGREGELAVRVKPRRPLGLFKEYWKNPDENAAPRIDAVNGELSRRAIVTAAPSSQVRRR